MDFTGAEVTPAMTAGYITVPDSATFDMQHQKTTAPQGVGVNGEPGTRVRYNHIGAGYTGDVPPMLEPMEPPPTSSFWSGPNRFYNNFSKQALPEGARTVDVEQHQDRAPPVYMLERRHLWEPGNLPPRQKPVGGTANIPLPGVATPITWGPSPLDNRRAAAIAEAKAPPPISTILRNAHDGVQNAIRNVMTFFVRDRTGEPTTAPFRGTAGVNPMAPADGARDAALPNPRNPTEHNPMGLGTGGNDPASSAAFPVADATALLAPASGVLGARATLGMDPESDPRARAAGGIDTLVPGGALGGSSTEASRAGASIPGSRAGLARGAGEETDPRLRAAGGIDTLVPGGAIGGSSTEASRAGASVPASRLPPAPWALPSAVQLAAAALAAHGGLGDSALTPYGAAGASIARPTPAGAENQQQQGGGQFAFVQGGDSTAGGLAAAGSVPDARGARRADDNNPGAGAAPDGQALLGGAAGFGSAQSGTTAQPGGRRREPIQVDHVRPATQDPLAKLPFGATRATALASSGAGASENNNNDGNHRSGDGPLLAGGQISTGVQSATVVGAAGSGSATEATTEDDARRGALVGGATAGLLGQQSGATLAAAASGSSPLEGGGGVGFDRTEAGVATQPGGTRGGAVISSRAIAGAAETTALEQGGQVQQSIVPAMPGTARGADVVSAQVSAAAGLQQLPGVQNALSELLGGGLLEVAVHQPREAVTAGAAAGPSEGESLAAASNARAGSLIGTAVSEATKEMLRGGVDSGAGQMVPGVGAAKHAIADGTRTVGGGLVGAGGVDPQAAPERTAAPPKPASEKVVAPAVGFSPEGPTTSGNAATAEGAGYFVSEDARETQQTAVRRSAGAVNGGLGSWVSAIGGGGASASGGSSPVRSRSPAELDQLEQDELQRMLLSGSRRTKANASNIRQAAQAMPGAWDEASARATTPPSR